LILSKDIPFKNEISDSIGLLYFVFIIID